jgi:hypothetical protein
MTSGIDIGVAESPGKLESIFQFRYRIYVVAPRNPTRIIDFDELKTPGARRCFRPVSVTPSSRFPINWACRVLEALFRCRFRTACLDRRFVRWTLIRIAAARFYSKIAGGTHA